ncbi:hypothetical protein [Streptomyces oceani]|uniref:hypothetical protein n=1 Tax=Streptomyces oceani TaxID=1075402 RepID=UPI001FCD10EF|nr:hypothetical protein [Streptomyces oceani]
MAVLTRRRDFALMRRYRSFTFRDHGAYLRHTERLLRSLARQGLSTTVGGFDPGEYAQYCARAGVDPDSADSRARYAARLAAIGRTVPYAGERIEALLPRLPEGERAVTAEAGERTGGRRSPTDGTCQAGPRLGDTFGADRFVKAAELLNRLLDALGQGSHSLVCSVRTPVAPLAAVLRAECVGERGADTHLGDRRPGLVWMDDDEALRFCAVLTVGGTADCAGGLVARSQSGTSKDQSAPTETVRGWSVRRDGLRALSEAEVFAAYCTDAETGEPVPPEPGVRYQPGIEL